MKRGSIAVMNPNSGPGSEVEQVYTEAISYCQHWLRNQRVIGYVYTDYTNRRLNDVIADINTYYQQYPDLDGIFVDEMANDPDGIIAAGGMTVKTYYGRIYRHVRLKGTRDNPQVVVGNPGRAASTAWQLDAPVADKVVVFEGFQERYATWTPPAWVHARPASRIVQLVHSAPAAKRHQSCQLSRARNAGFVYVTDDVLRPIPGTGSRRTGSTWHRPASRPEPDQTSVPALSSTTRRICSISSKCSWVQFSGGESCTTGSPRSSARQ